jgi:hypothetical protein
MLNFASLKKKAMAKKPSKRLNLVYARRRAKLFKRKFNPPVTGYQKTLEEHNRPVIASILERLKTA